MSMIAQEGDKIKRMLIAVSKAADAGNAVLVNVDKDLINKLANEPTIHRDMVVDKRKMVKSKMEREGGLYVLPMWIKKRANADTINMTEGDKSIGEKMDPWAPF